MRCQIPSIGRYLWCLTATAVAAALTLGAAAAAPVTHHPTPVHAPVNPHLHGVAARPGEGRGRSRERTVTHTRWAHHWDSYAWFALHRGTGVVEGTVRNAQGRPLAGLDVRLRDWWGHGFHSNAAKHITHTGAGGQFVMTHVRAGRYRVRASVGSKSGHAMLVLHAGQIAQVAVKV